MSATYNYELIKDYLDGILDTRTANAIKEQIQHDETARTIAKGILHLEERFEANDELIDQYLNDRLQKQARLINTTKKNHAPFSWVKIAAAVALLMVSGLLVYQFTRPSMDDLIAQELSEPYRIPSVYRSTDEETRLSKAIQAYGKRNYQQVVNLVEGINQPEAIFIQGISYLYLDQPYRSIAELTNPSLAESRYEEQSRWFLALAYLKSDQKVEAKELLTSISSGGSHYKKQEAATLLQKLD